MCCGPAIITSSTLDTCWSTILAQTDEEAAGRSNYAESLQIDVCDSLKNLEKRMGALRTKVSFSVIWAASPTGSACVQGICLRD